MPCNQCANPARCDAVGLCQEYRGEVPRAPVLSDAQIDELWLTRSNIHGGELMPQLRDFARAVMGADGVTATGPVEVPASEEIMALVQKFGEQCMDCGAWPGARAPGGQELRWRQGDASVTFEKIAKALRAPLARQGTPALPPEVRQAIAKGHCICAPRGLRADPDCPQHGVGVTGTLNDQQEQPR